MIQYVIYYNGSRFIRRNYPRLRDSYYYIVGVQRGFERKRVVPDKHDSLSLCVDKFAEYGH